MALHSRQDMTVTSGVTAVRYAQRSPEPHSSCDSLALDRPLVPHLTKRDSQKVQGTESHHPRILSLSFLTIIGKIRGPKKVEMQTQRHREILPGHKDPQCPTGQTPGKLDTGPADPSKTERVWTPGGPDQILLVWSGFCPAEISPHHRTACWRPVCVYSW